MFKSLGLLIRILIIISRDMLTGLIMGLCAAMLLFSLNPGLSDTVALLIPLGISAGLFKSMAKVFFLTLSGVLPTADYIKSYPRFKILGFWMIILIGTFVYVFGFNTSLWVSEPLRLLQINNFIGTGNTGLWTFIFFFVFVIGLISYFIEIPFYRDDHSAKKDLSLKEEHYFEDEKDV